MSVGIDFGTTNSVLAVASAGGIRVARHGPDKASGQFPLDPLLRQGRFGARFGFARQGRFGGYGCLP